MSTFTNLDGSSGKVYCSLYVQFFYNIFIPKVSIDLLVMHAKTNCHFIHWVPGYHRTGQISIADFLKENDQIS